MINWNEDRGSMKREPEPEECKGVWVPKIIEGGEVSVIRKDFKHGFHSWGWEGPAKIVIADVTNEELPPKLRKIVKEEVLKFAKELAFCLNVADKTP
jgi:hypothetical protein